MRTLLFCGHICQLKVSQQKSLDQTLWAEDVQSSDTGLYRGLGELFCCSHSSQELSGLHPSEIEEVLNQAVESGEEEEDEVTLSSRDPV